MTNKLYCEECHDWIIPIEGVTSIFMFGNHWCAKHANIHYENGVPLIKLPSKGKLKEAVK